MSHDGKLDIGHDGHLFPESLSKCIQSVHILSGMIDGEADGL